MVQEDAEIFTAGIYNSANMTDIHKIPFDYCLDIDQYRYSKEILILQWE